MGSKRKRKQQKKNVPEITEEDLKRFDDGEDEDEQNEGGNAVEDDEAVEGEAAEEEQGGVASVVMADYDADDNMGNENEAESESDSEPKNDDDDDEIEKFIEPESNSSSAAKMADAMAKILGTTVVKSNSAPVVLARTKTPLQKMAQEEKDKQKAMRDKRQANRERNLVALHIPMSVATTNQTKSVTKELEQERLHRRVATRGVVALFNAISQHQKTNEEEELEVKDKEVPKLTKLGFLDKIKNSAAANTAATKKIKMSTEGAVEAGPFGN